MPQRTASGTRHASEWNITMAKLAAPLAIVLLMLASLHTGPGSAAAQPAAGVPSPSDVVHQYTIDGSIRPFLLFWISRSDIGRATITWRHDPQDTEYSLLIGTDPSRAPRHLNRWGYADEQLRRGTATILGVMTRSDEQSLDQARANVSHASGQPQAFRVIRESVDGQLARSAVMTLGTRQHYTFKQLDDVLAQVPPASQFQHHRSLTLPPGTEPGFLAALNHLIGETLSGGSTEHPAPVRYVYSGKLYLVRASDVNQKDEIKTGSGDYQHLLEASFDIHNVATGDDTDFDMTYGTEGALRGIPVTVQYQPRWWLRLELTLTGPSS
ncbi:MAG TPA: hypothetical protein VIC33_01035 [Vicinamibacterales bacterium]